MRKKLSQDVWVLLGLLALLLVLGVVTGRQSRRGNGVEVVPRSTSYSSQPGGVKALYETLDKLGYNTRRHLQELTTLPQDGVLFIIQPEAALSASEWRSVQTWVERGNILVVASGVPVPGFDTHVKARRSAATCPSFLAPGVEFYSVLEPGRIEDDDWRFQHNDDFAQPFG